MTGLNTEAKLRTTKYKLCKKCGKNRVPRKVHLRRHSLHRFLGRRDLGCHSLHSEVLVDLSGNGWNW
jgi:hypothetical protein